jgi:hypothetical protein
VTVTITDIWLDRAREQIACRTSEGDIIVLDVGKAGRDTGTGAELHLLADSVDMPDEAWHHPIGPDWPPTQPDRRGPRAAVQTPLSGRSAAWNAQRLEQPTEAGPARERPIQAPSPYPRPASQRGWSVPTDAERKARVPGWPVPVEVARDYEPPVQPALDAQAGVALGLCDGCGATDQEVAATDDGRAQVCPTCRRTIEYLDTQAAEAQAQPRGPIAYPSSIEQNPTAEEINP